MKKIILVLVIIMLSTLSINARPFKLIKAIDIGLNINDITNIKYKDKEEYKNISVNKDMSLFFKLTTGLSIERFKITGSYEMTFNNNVNYDFINITASYNFKHISIIYNFSSSSPKGDTIFNYVSHEINYLTLSFYKEF